MSERYTLEQYEEHRRKVDEKEAKAEQDKHLPDKLREEGAGILAWAVEGCQEWRREGLQAPDEVRQATGAYRAEMDVLGAFLRECCELGPEMNVAARDLYAVYHEWCLEGGERPESKRKFGSRLTERGSFERYRGGSDGGHRWRGLDLLTFWKERICRDSDLSDVKVTFSGKKLPSRGQNGKLGSEGSEGSARTHSEDLAPGESATVEQLQKIRKLRHEGMSEARAREEVLGKGWVEP